MKITRREFIKTTAIGALAAACPGNACAKGGTSSTKPNIVILFTDDQGYSDVGCFGGKHVKTPHIDRMAEEGMKLTRFYAAPVCSPSRAAIMTGCYPSRVNLSKGSRYPVLLCSEKKGLNPEEATIADVLRTAGYSTACIGKWHLGDQPEFMPNRQGFDYFFGLPYSHDMYPEYDLVRAVTRGTVVPPLYLFRNERIIGKSPDPSLLTQRFTDESISLIRKNKDRPFFLYLPYCMPHRPCHASDDFTKDIPKEKLRETDDKLKQGEVEFSDYLYEHSINEMDWSVGEILKTLKELGLDDRTLVVFTSDNGPANGLGSAVPFRGRKNSSYEGGLRVPCVARWPGTIRAGSSFDKITSTMDLLPTAAYLAGEELPKKTIDGKNIIDILTGKTMHSPYEEFYYYRTQKLEGVSDGKWKLIHGQLYDIEADPEETHSLAKQYPEKVTELTEKIESMKAKLGHGNQEGSEQRPAGWVENAKPLSRDR
jgi:arylsulfatase A-like enzyme